MGRMLCKVCGYVGGPGEAECPECGAPLWPEKAAEAATPEPTEEVYITTKPKAKPKEKKPSSPRRAHACLAAGFLAVCLLVQGLGLWKLTGQQVPDWSMVWYGELVTPRGIVPLEAGMEPIGTSFGPMGWDLGPRRLFWNLEDFVMGGIGGQPATYYYDGKTVQETNWTGAGLSQDNQVLFYVSDLPEGGQVLCRRDERTLRVQELDRGERLAVTNSDAAGDALSYMKQTGEDVQALLWRRGSPAPEELDAMVYYMAPGGHSYLAYNYAAYLNGDLDPSSGEPSWDWVAVWDDTGRRTYLPGGNFIVDQNVTELLYRDDTGVWCYENAAGEQARLEDLPKGLQLWQVPVGEGVYAYISRPPRLTDWLYTGNDGALYYLSEDLTVTVLSDSADIQNAVMDDGANTLFYLTTELGEVETTFYRVDEPLSPDRQIVRELEQDDVKAFTVSPDGSAVLAKVRPGSEPGKAVCKISVGGGPWQTLEMDAPVNTNYFTIDGVQLMNGGGCWYLDSATSLHKALCYRSPSGETSTKLTWTSPASSTMYPDEPGAVTLPGSVVEMDMELMAVFGDQALLRVSSGEKWKHIEHDPPITSEPEPEARYWLLDKDGSMTELERLEVS